MSANDNQQLYLEIAGVVADLAGFVDPTPTSDTISAGIAFYQGDVAGGVISLVGIIPYIGDLAKLGKLPRYLGVVRLAIRTSVQDVAFARKVGPLLRKLKTILGNIPREYLPASAAAAIDGLKAELRMIAETLPPPRISGAIQAIQNPILRKLVADAVALPLVRNPRLLAKHPGPISEKKLVEELTSKEFKHIKPGTHGPGGTPKYGGAEEDSDVFMRRIKNERGQEIFEAVRFDKHTPNPKLGNPQLKPGHNNRYQNPRGEIRPWDNKTESARQADAKPYHRTHHSLEDPSTPADAMDHVQEGRARKSDFSHWHRETFPATDDNLVKYLGKENVQGLRKFDPMGLPVNVP